MLLFGAAAQFGIFFVIIVAGLLGFNLADSASAGIIAAADGPTSIFVANSLQSKYLGAIMVAAYSYMALVPIIQPIAIKARDHQEGAPDSHGLQAGVRFPRRLRSSSRSSSASSPASSAPASLPLVGFLMFGNLLRECGVLDNLSMSAQNELVNLISILLGLCVSVRMQAGEFLQVDTLIIMGLGLLGFVMDTVGASCSPRCSTSSARRRSTHDRCVGHLGVPHELARYPKLATEEDPGNFILMQAAGSNVAGQIASVVAGGLILGIVPGLM